MPFALAPRATILNLTDRQRMTRETFSLNDTLQKKQPGNTFHPPPITNDVDFRTAICFPYPLAFVTRHYGRHHPRNIRYLSAGE